MKLSNRKQLLEEADMTLKSLVKESPITRQMRDKEHMKKSMEIGKTVGKIRMVQDKLKTIDNWLRGDPADYSATRLFKNPAAEFQQLEKAMGEIKAFVISEFEQDLKNKKR